jgi:uncharacterized protein YyaL (SSP411 family)
MRCARAASTTISAAVRPVFDRCTLARPHFEKMLYDNAELVDLLTLVWQDTKNPLYLHRVDETLGWVGREMLTPEGVREQSRRRQRAREGKFYVWSEAEIDAVLGRTRSSVQTLLRVTWKVGKRKHSQSVEVARSLR